MELETLLAEKKSAIVKRWFHAVADSYPPDTARFLKKEKDPFANPVGRTVAKEVEALFDALLEGADPEGVNDFLDRVIRIRAVQDFTPSQAVSFIPLLKGVIREAVAKENRDGRLDGQLLVFEARIDGLLLQAFDIFVGCREQLYKISANEVRNQSFRLLERFNLLGDQVFRPGRRREKQDDNSAA